MAGSSPEAVITEQLRVSLVELVLEARAMRRDASLRGDRVDAWMEVCAWLEAKLPPGVEVEGEGATVPER